MIAPDDLELLRLGQHPRPYVVLGAHQATVGKSAGVRFAVLAPNARQVSVVGDFNDWDPKRNAMQKHAQAGVWAVFVPGVEAGALYKFALITADGEVLPFKADPYARAAQLRPDTASIVTALPAPRMLPAGRAAANRRDGPISIYEVHAGSWRRGGDGGFMQWDELADQLPDYVSSLGFTHIELMPVSEFPFDGSWGYQTLGLYALSARFGPWEAFDGFVDACHAKGLGVLLDWVPAHFPMDAHGLAQFDGTALFEHADPREGFHRDWNTLIYNFGRNEVRNFLVGNARYWSEQHAIDGLRVDAVASMLYRDYSRAEGEWVPNILGGNHNLEAIALLQEINTAIGVSAPGCITVAEESTTFPGVSAPVSAGGLGFHYKWNMGWMNDTLCYMQEDPVHRKWHHDKMSFGLVYAFDENFVLPLSHDEVVHGKGALVRKMPGDVWQRFANLRAYYGFMWGHPGKKLLFMGQEFAQPTEWNYDAPLPWDLLNDPAHAGVQTLVRDLNLLYRSQTALHQLDCEARGFEWLVSEDAEQSVFAWLRRDASGSMVMVVCNFTPIPRHGYRIGVPFGTSSGMTGWREVLNTDAAIYGGSNVGNVGISIAVEPLPAQTQTQSIALTLPPLATLFLQPVQA